MFDGSSAINVSFSWHLVPPLSTLLVNVVQFCYVEYQLFHHLSHVRYALT